MHAIVCSNLLLLPKPNAVFIKCRGMIQLCVSNKSSDRINSGLNSFGIPGSVINMKVFITHAWYAHTCVRKSIKIGIKKETLPLLMRNNRLLDLLMIFKVRKWSFVAPWGTISTPAQPNYLGD